MLMDNTKESFELSSAGNSIVTNELQANIEKKPSEKKNNTRHIKRSSKAIFGAILFTNISIVIGVIIVCLTRFEPNTKGSLNFLSIINTNFVQYNSHPHSIAVTDLNNDTWLDLIVVNTGANNIEIFSGSSNGNYTLSKIYLTEDDSHPISVIVADFNNDTYLDIAVTNYKRNNIGLFFGYGNGSFTEQTMLSTNSSRPISLAVGDFNNDHCLDIVMTNNGTNNIGILLGYCNGSFRNLLTYDTGYDSFPYSVVVADFNNDSQQDIAVTNYGTDNIGLFLGYGNGSFATQLIHSTGSQSKPYSLVVNDFNLDHRLDIAVANTGATSIGIFLGYGNGSFAPQESYLIKPKSNLYSIVVGYFNEDNQLDIAVSNYDTDYVTIFVGFGNGSFAFHTLHQTGTGSGPFGMVVADFDHNNQSDLVVANSITNNIHFLIDAAIKQIENPFGYSTGDGSSPFSIVSRDLNNDTQLDLVVANYGTDNVGIFFGYGNGSFQEQIIYSTGYNSHPYAVAINDMDNDHYLDIIVGNSNTESLGILFGYGNGSFTSVIKYFTGSYSSIISLVIADFNNDTQVDIAFADYGANNLGILFGDGNRNFRNVILYSTGGSSRTRSIATGDFNNDAYLDIVIANYGTDNIYIYLGSNSGTFRLFLIYSTGVGSTPTMVITADLNKDKQLDIIVVNNAANNVGIFYGYGNASFLEQITYSTSDSSNPNCVNVADVNNDSWLDLVIANQNINNIGILLGNDNGSFQNQTTYSSGINSHPSYLTIGDFNNDKRLDVGIANSGTQNIVVLLGRSNVLSQNQTICTTDFNSTISNCTSNDIPVLLGDYYVNFTNRKTYPTGSSSSPYSVASGDFNNDGYVDLVVANSGNENIGVLIQYSNKTFLPEVKYSVGSGSNPLTVIVEDFNKDHQLDIAVTDPRQNSISLFMGYGNGSFAKQITYSTGAESYPTFLTVADFNDDNWLDLAVTNKGTNTIGIFFGFDYTSFNEQNPCQTDDNSGPITVATGDFNNDGRLDIVSGNYYTNNVGIFLGYGDGTFTSLMTYANIPASHPWAVAVGDFNHDNFLDITIANWGSDNIGVVLGYGNGSFGIPKLYSTESGSHPLAIAVGDLNNDKHLDITVANWGRGNIAVLLGYGNGTFQDIMTFSTGKDSGPTSVSIIDINNDTYSDIIVTNEITNNMGVFLGYGNGSFAEQMVFSTGDNSAPYSAVLGDFNHDHYFDIAIANFNTDNLGVLFGYGNGTFGNLQIYDTGVGSGPTYVNIGYFNNDTQLDIIVANQYSSNIGIFFGYTDGTFASMAVIPLESDSNPTSVAVADFNNDNHLDFVVSDPNNNMNRIFLADGSLPFGGQTTFFIGNNTQPSSITVAHFNDDNLLDIAVTNYGTNDISVLLGYPNRMFSNVATYSTGENSYPSSLVAGDFNNDSLIDIIVANSNTNNILIFIGHGNGNFSLLMNYSTGISSQPMSVNIADFNQDNQLDIGIASFGTNNICLFFGSGNGSFTNQTWYPLEFNAKPSSIIFNDLDHNGRQDIIVSTSGTNNIKILWNIC